MTPSGISVTPFGSIHVLHIADVFSSSSVMCGKACDGTGLQSKSFSSSSPVSVHVVCDTFGRNDSSSYLLLRSRLVLVTPPSRFYPLVQKGTFIFPESASEGFLLCRSSPGGVDRAVPRVPDNRKTDRKRQFFTILGQATVGLKSTPGRPKVAPKSAQS